MNVTARTKSISAGLTLLWLLVMLLVLAGCLKTTTPATGTKYIPCPALQAILYSGREDSELTKAQIKEYNAVFDENCK